MDFTNGFFKRKIITIIKIKILKSLQLKHFLTPAHPEWQYYTDISFTDLSA